MCPKTVDVHIVKTLLNKNKLASTNLGEKGIRMAKKKSIRGRKDNWIGGRSIRCLCFINDGC